MNAGGGIGVGLRTNPADLPTDLSGTYNGRVTGHIGEQPSTVRRRYTMDGEIELDIVIQAGQPEFTGRIFNTQVVEVNRDTMELAAGATIEDWHDVALQGSGLVDGNGFEGTATASGTAGAGPDFSAGNGFYFGRFYGPAAEEVAGEWGIRTNDRLGLVVGGFGARRSDPEPGGTTLDEIAKPKTLAENNYRVSRLDRRSGFDLDMFFYIDNARGSRPDDTLPGGFANPYDIILSADDSGIDYSLRLGGSYGYQGTYTFTPDDRVAGFHQARTSPLTWQPVWQIREEPSDANNDHDVILSVTDRAAPGGDLDYARYGWWAITPYDGGPAHSYYFTMNAGGGIGVGLPTDPADLPTDLSGTYNGRVTGHIGEQPSTVRRRYTMDGEIELDIVIQAGQPEFTGRIFNTQVLEVNRDTMERADGATIADWHDVALQGSGLVDGNGFEGTATASGTAGAGPDFSAGSGFYFGRFYGPAAEEVAGEWGIRTNDRLGLVVGGFGAKKQ